MSQNPQETLTRLQEQLKQVIPADEDSRQRLEDTQLDIREALERMKSDQPDDTTTLVERLQKAVYEFEGEHPEIATAISTVLNSLSNMGL